MHGKPRRTTGKSNACLAVLALILLAPFAGAAGSATGSASSNATLQAFADGTVGKTLAFGAGADADSSVLVRLPRNATVASASLDATIAGNSTASSGALVFDVGADGVADAAASVSILGTTRVDLPAQSFNAYLASQGSASGNVEVPVKVTGAASSAWTVVLDGLAVEFSSDVDVQATPHFAGEIAAMAVVAGGVNRSQVDLGAHFTGSNLTYSARLAADADASASGVVVVVNGSNVDILSANANWWGQVAVKFAAADAAGQVAFSNDVVVHVTPGPMQVPTTRTEAQVDARTVVVAACGAPVVVGTFKVPSDAVVTQAKMSIEGAVGFEALGATVGIVTGLEAVAGVNLSDLPASVELNASALNARIRGSASSWGLVDLDLAADVCPSGATANLRVGNLSVTYTRGAVNATASSGTIAGIAVGGALSGEVTADEALRLDLETNGTLASGTQVSWYLDGKFAGSGSTLQGVTLCRGNHTVEARATAGTSLQVYRTTVKAAAKTAAQAAIAIDGIVTAAVKSGTTLIVELRTPEPMSADASVDWYIDGRFAGHGQVLANVTLAPGTHSVEARSTAGGSVHTYASEVTASSAPSAANVTAAVLVCAAILAATLGAVAVRHRKR
jgi:hypothetical protein